MSGACVGERGPGLRRAGFVWVPGWVDARGQMDGWADRLAGMAGSQSSFRRPEGRSARPTSKTWRRS